MASVNKHDWTNNVQCLFFQLFNFRGDVLGYIDGGTRPLTSWLSYIQCARTDKEQNLEVVQSGRNIYYRAIKVNFIEMSFNPQSNPSTERSTSGSACLNP